ncbi:hypothetical protein NP493_610g02022 [Ridgeia piscesae]|uniref:Polyprenal reductase n=1 Tax=Ridgeia piscesae TaxID=27915 RepID=A0AAD9NQR0_RIDPI|nr:hypothetical protein NP493_610g02022 [Ridgeia piscesae]
MTSAILCLFWTFVSLAILAAGYLHAYGFKSSQIFNDILLFGKLHDTQRKRTVIQYIEVPKRWFYHFYLVGVIVNSCVCYHVTVAYVYMAHPPAIIEGPVKFLQSSHHANIDAATAIMLLAMMCVQTGRRLVECLCVSVYSHSTINIFHYIYGIVFYASFGATVLSEAPAFNGQTRVHVADFFKWQCILGMAMFLYASWQQYNIHVMFARLRQNKAGGRSDLKHHIPRGGWFEVVSCPHYLMELVIYSTLLVMSSLTHRALWTVTLSVFVSQMTTGHFTHRWYHEHFEKYTHRRTAVIPFVF